MFHSEISGIDIRFEHPKNIEFILVAFVVSHLEILGKDINESQPLNKSFMRVTFLVFQFKISGKDSNESTITKDISHINNNFSIPFRNIWQRF